MKAADMFDGYFWDEHLRLSSRVFAYVYVCMYGRAYICVHSCARVSAFSMYKLDCCFARVVNIRELRHLRLFSNNKVPMQSHFL